MKSKVEVACLTQNPALDNPPQVLVNYHPQKTVTQKNPKTIEMSLKGQLVFFVADCGQPNIGSAAAVVV